MDEPAAGVAERGEKEAAGSVPVSSEMGTDLPRE
jgi:hypothetical protein